MLDILAYITWDVDPIAFNILGKDIVWYGVFWATGVLLTSIVVQKIFEKEKYPEKWFDTFFLYVVVALIIGARLGHCLFYDPVYYLSNPLEMFKVWEGGLASHGGAIGMTIAVWLFCRKVAKKSIIWGLDRLVVGVAIGATFIRIGNLMNHEVYGNPTEMPWGFRFITNIHQWQKGMEPIYSLPSHPTQIYEALIYFCVFLLGMYMVWRTSALQKQGLILGISLILIFGSRFIIETIKHEQEGWELDMINTIGMNMGQVLSLPFVLWGIWLLCNVWNKRNQTVIKNSK